MPRISPFVGLLFDPARIGSLDRVTTPPYDTITPEARRRFLDADPHNVVRLVLAEGQRGDDEADSKYRRAASELRSWRQEGVLVPTPSPAYFPYEMRFALHGRPRTIRGLICLVELEPWGGSIVPHERTMPGPVDDRLRLLRAVGANLSPIHTMFSGRCPILGELLDEATTRDPVACVTDEEGVEHRMWTTRDDGGVAECVASETLMIADGHHRYTTALRFRDEMRERHGPGPWDRVMTLMVDATLEDPPVLPFHRMLAAGPVPREGARVRDLEEVLAAVDDDQLRYGCVTHEDGGLVHRVTELPGVPPLVCELHERVLAGRDADLRFTPDAVEAEEAVRDGTAAAAFFLPATTASKIRTVLDRGERLPQKSTFFWPKPRTGMVIRPLE